MEEDYSYYWKRNVSITTSGNYNTRGLKYCIDEIGLDRCLYAIGKSLLLGCNIGDPDRMTRYTIRDRKGEIIEGAEDDILKLLLPCMRVLFVCFLSMME